MLICCIWYDFVSYSQRYGIEGMGSDSCIWYDFVSYSQRNLPTYGRSVCCIWYDFVSYSQRNTALRFQCVSCIWYDFVSYSQQQHRDFLALVGCIWYDFSAIHNNLVCFIFSFKLYMIWFCQYVKELSSTIIRCRCKDKEKTIIFKILSDKKSCRIIFFCIFASKNQIWRINGYFKENRVS